MFQHHVKDAPALAAILGPVHQMFVLFDDGGPIVCIVLDDDPTPTQEE